MQPLKLSESTERLYESAVQLIPRGRPYSMAAVQAYLRNRIGISDEDARLLVLVMFVRGDFTPTDNGKVVRL